MEFRFKVSWSLLDIVLYSLLWLILSIITFGIALFFAPYAWTARVLNDTQLLDAQGRAVGVIRVQYSFADQAVHMLKWLLLTIITLGFAYPFYFWGVVRSVIDHARVSDEF